MNWKPDPVEPKKTVAPVVPDRGVGRGRGDPSGRGRPGRGGGAGRGGNPQQAPSVGHEELGKIPKNYKVCKDTHGRDICIRFQSGNCANGVQGMCGKGSRMRLHVCATITNVSKMTLCLATDHAHSDCPTRVE